MHYLCIVFPTQGDDTYLVMGQVIRKVIDVSEQKITTNDGQKFIRRVTTVQMPNGKCRYPVDYYRANAGTVRITEEERQRRRIPVYEEVI